MQSAPTPTVPPVVLLRVLLPLPSTTQARFPPAHVLVHESHCAGTAIRHTSGFEATLSATAFGASRQLLPRLAQSPAAVSQPTPFERNVQRMFLAARVAASAVPSSVASAVHRSPASAATGRAGGRHDVAPRRERLERFDAPPKASREPPRATRRAP
jgi:hypothetical protein